MLKPLILGHNIYIMITIQWLLDYLKNIKRSFMLYSFLRYTQCISSTNFYFVYILQNNIKIKGEGINWYMYIHRSLQKTAFWKLKTKWSICKFDLNTGCHRWQNRYALQFSLKHVALLPFKDVRLDSGTVLQNILSNYIKTNF